MNYRTVDLLLSFSAEARNCHLVNTYLILVNDRCSCFRLLHVTTMSKYYLVQLERRSFTKSPPTLLQCALFRVSRLWPVLQIILTIRQNWTDTRTESDRQIQTNTFSPALVCSLCQSSCGETTLYFQSSSTAGLSIWVCVCVCTESVSIIPIFSLCSGGC